MAGREWEKVKGLKGKFHIRFCSGMKTLRCAVVLTGGCPCSALSSAHPAAPAGGTCRCCPGRSSRRRRRHGRCRCSCILLSGPSGSTAMSTCVAALLPRPTTSSPCPCPCPSPVPATPPASNPWRLHLSPTGDRRACGGGGRAGGGGRCRRGCRTGSGEGRRIRLGSIFFSVLNDRESGGHTRNLWKLP